MAVEPRVSQIPVSPCLSIKTLKVAESVSILLTLNELHPGICGVADKHNYSGQFVIGTTLST